MEGKADDLSQTESAPLDENYRLGTRNIESLAAGTASQHVIDAHHIVARVLKLTFVVFAGASRRCGFLGALQPTDFVIVAGAAVRAAKTSGL